MDFASMRRIIHNRNDSNGHAIDSDGGTGPMGSGSDREITVNVEQVTRNIDRNDAVYQSTLLLGM
jgi:hypothetical protein